MAHRGAGRGQDPPEAGLWIADTLGELGLLYRLAPIVLVGGSLVPIGGQNPLEPARLGASIAMGPHTEKAADSVRRLTEAGALARVTGAAILATWVDAMLRDRAGTGQAALGVATAERDLPARLAATIVALMPPP